MSQTCQSSNCQSPNRSLWRNLMPLLIAVGVLCAATLVAGLTAISAFAHHPGSHAWRQTGSDQVKLEAVATAGDGCTFIGAVTSGAPEGQVAPPDAFPVTVRLRKPAGAEVCTAVVTALKHEALLTVPRTSNKLHLFILKTDGSLQTTERVNIK